LNDGHGVSRGQGRVAWRRAWRRARLGWASRDPLLHDAQRCPVSGQL